MASFGSASRRFFVAAWPLAVVIALAGCAPPQGTEPRSPTQASPPAARQGPARLGARPRPATPPAPAAPAPGSPQLSVSPPAPVGSTPPAATPAGPQLPAVVLTPPPGVKKTVAVGLLLPLSGPEAALGRSLLEAATLALFEVADDQFVLLPRDTKGTPDGAREAAASAIEAGARLLLGPVFAPAVKEVSPLARSANVNVIAFSNDRAVAGAGTFVFGVPPLQAIQRVVGYAARRGLTRFAALVPDSPFGRRVADDLAVVAVRSGGVMTRIESYGATQQDMTRAVQKLASWEARRAAMERQRTALENAADEVARQALRRLEGAEALGGVGFDAVLLPDSGASLSAVAPLLPYYDIDTRRIRVLGIGDWRARPIVREPALAGAWVAGLSPVARGEFERRFEAAFGHPAHTLAPLAYDAAALAAVLATGGKDTDFSLAALTTRNGFAGSAGVFRFHSDGTVEHGLAVMEVRPDGVRVIDAEPEAFPEAGG